MTRLIPGGSALFVLGVLIAMSACGAEPSGGVGSTPPPTPVGAGTPAGGAAKPTSAERTVSGVIIEGIRPSCRVLQTTQRRYALVGVTTQSLQQGDKVTVTGVERADLVNPCGLTFVVAGLKIDTRQ